MYQRIMNDLDMKNMIKAPKVISGRIGEITDILNKAYGNNRKPSDNGGYALFFPTVKDVEESLESVMKYYKIDSDIAEYREVYKTEENDWIEELYLLSSEDALVLFYPKMKGV